MERFESIPKWYKIPELVKNEKIKARRFSYDSQMYLLMLGQFLHVFSLNELADISNIYAKELSHIRGIDPAIPKVQPQMFLYGGSGTDLRSARACRLCRRRA